MPVLKAVYDEDLELFLRKLGLWERVVSGELKCHQCGKLITVENFGAVKTVKGKLIVFCNSFQCIAQNLQYEE